MKGVLASMTDIKQPVIHKVQYARIPTITRRYIGLVIRCEALKGRY